MNSNKNKLLAVVIGGLLLIIVIIVIINSQPQSTYVYIPPPQPQWRDIETFSIQTGDSHLFTCAYDYWKIEWTVGKAPSSDSKANLYCGIGVNPRVLDTFNIDRDGSKIYSNLPCEDGYTLEITGNDGWLFIVIWAYY